MKHSGREAATLQAAIADHLGAEQSLLDLVVVEDANLVSDIRVDGLKVSGIVAPVHRQAPRTEDSTTTPVVFIDGRAVGRGMRSLNVSPGHLDPVAILRLLDPQLPAGYAAQLTLLDGRSLADVTVESNSYLVVRIIVCQSPESSARLSEVHAAPAFAASVPNMLGSSAGGVFPSLSGVPTPGVYASAVANCAKDSSARYEDGPEVPCFIDKAWFLIFAPDRAPEEVWVSFEQPASWEDVSASIIGARQDDHNQVFDNLISVYPQPSDEFGSLLCLPSWAADAVSVLVDSRQFDVRLYCLVVEPWMQWESFRIRANLPEARDFAIIIRGILQPRGRPLNFSQGDLIVIQDVGIDFPPIIDLCAMLAFGDRWNEEEPLAISPSWSHYLVLHDGGALGVEVDFKKISNSFGFVDFAAELLRFEVHRTTLKGSSPRIRDAMHKGVKCQAVVILTECLPTVPVPPGRVTVQLTTIVLDLRPLLKGFSWKVLVQGETTLESLLRDTVASVPPGFEPRILGGEQYARHGIRFFRAADRVVITVSLCSVAISPSVDASSQGGESSNSEDNSDSSSSSSPDGDPHARPSGARSRSSRRRLARNKGRPGVSGVLHAILGGLYRRNMHGALGEVDPRRGGFGVFAFASPGVLAHRSDLAPTESDAVSVHAVLTSTSDTAPKADTSPRDVEARLLDEPAPRDSCSAQVLARLRRVTRQLGQPWRYALAPDATVLDDDDENSDDEPGVLAQVQCLRVCIVALVQTPTTVDDAVHCVQACRAEGLAAFFPKVVPVRPQPHSAQFFFLALPSWSVAEVTTKIAVCFDTSAVDGRVFATLVPEYVSRQQLLTLADLPTGFEYHVNVGPTDGDIAQTSTCHVVEGELVRFGFSEDEQFPLATIEQELITGEGRSAGGPILCQPASDAYLLVDGRDNILHLADFGRPTRYREQIAACVGIRLRDLRLFPSQPRSEDAALEGMPCRTTIAVRDAHRYTSADTFEVLVDARAVLLGWFTVTAVACRVSCNYILQTLAPEVSPQLLLSIADVPAGTDILEVRPGQILTVRAGQVDVAGAHPAEPAEPLGERRDPPGYGPTSGDIPPGHSRDEGHAFAEGAADTPENPPATTETGGGDRLEPTPLSVILTQRLLSLSRASRLSSFMSGSPKVWLWRMRSRQWQRRAAHTIRRVRHVFGRSGSSHEETMPLWSACQIGPLRAASLSLTLVPSMGDFLLLM